MDREKVIKGLECHRIDNNHRINCADCPYYVDDHIRCVNDLHDDALALLKEQEAKQIEAEVINEIDRFYRCPSCHISMVLRGQPYCHSCGQAVKWE